MNQAVLDDPGRYEWDSTKTKVFNVHIVNTQYFEQITGKSLPEPFITAELSAALGYPFFHMNEEPSKVAGEFDTIKSVAQMDNITDATVDSTVVDKSDPRPS
jgi:hypothetical protein